MNRAVGLVLVFLMATTACHSLQTRSYPPSTVPADSTQMIVGATTLAGEEIAFDRGTRQRMEGGRIVEAVPAARVDGNAIVGTTDGASRTVSLAEVRDLQIEERQFSPARTAAAVGGVVIVPYVVFLIFFKVACDPEAFIC